MGLEPDTRLVLNDEVDLRSLPLTPTDFFVYSRIKGLAGASAAVSDVVAASGQPTDVASAAIAKLVELDVIRVEAPVAPSASSPPPEPGEPRLEVGHAELRARAHVRKRELLAAQMRAVRDRSESSSSSSAGSGTDESEMSAQLPVSRSASAPEASSEPRSILDEVEPVAETDPRLIPTGSVDLDRQRRLLALRDRLRHVGHFELLSLAPTDDIKEIRRAYHLVSRDFHPDSFYGKELGDFRQILDDLFRRARVSYEFLLDADRRRPLVEAFSAQRATEQQQRDRQVEIEAGEEAARAQRSRRELQAAREAQARERQRRIQERALGKRRRQGAKYAERARQELLSDRHGAAATLFRLAHEQDPNNAEYEAAWRDSLLTARRRRAALSHARGLEALEQRKMAEAASHFAAAADADPTLRHLGDAAGAMAEVDPTRARGYALAALEALNKAIARGLPLEQTVVGQVHLACASAFASAGQSASAREHAQRAHELAPSVKTQTLLNSIKVT